jgi:histidinol-phosphate aminotransferase
MDDLTQLVVPGVRGLQPYQPGKPVDMLERELGIKNAIKLASNENPCGPADTVKELLANNLSDLSRYPDGNGFYLKQALAKKHQLDVAQITLGNGSNDVLEFVARAFACQGNTIVFSEHAFAVYPIVTMAVGATPRIVKAKDWGNDLDTILEAIDASTRVVFIANPNNPTGTWLDDKSLRTFLDQVPGHVIVVLDEAYYEYASDPRLQAQGYPDGSQWLNDYPNLLVTRTFSKAYGLAGLRIGYGLSSVELADFLNRVRQPFNVNTLALLAAEKALSDEPHLQHSLDVNVAGMQQIIKGLDALSLGYIPSIANFIAIDFSRPANDIYQALLHEGVIVRPVANYNMPDFLRVSIGLPEENEKFLLALKKVLV